MTQARLKGYNRHVSTEGTQAKVSTCQDKETF